QFQGWTLSRLNPDLSSFNLMQTPLGAILSLEKQSQKSSAQQWPGRQSVYRIRVTRIIAR
ncbi:MAG: hypothetical protein AAF709_22415, partial [Pseudomonadota bacterium]